MHEVGQLESAIAKLSTCKKHERVPLEKAVLLWGGRTHHHIAVLYDLLDRQLKWLDANEGHARYEERFQDWLSTLEQYTHANDVLAVAKGLHVGVAA
jgi:hypothetical protein